MQRVVADSKTAWPMITMENGQLRDFFFSGAAGWSRKTAQCKRVEVLPQKAKTQSGV